MRETALLIVMTGVLLGTAVLHPGLLKGAFESLQHHKACRHLPGLARQLCAAYQSAAGADHFTAAAHWRQLSPASCECMLACCMSLKELRRDQWCHHRSCSALRAAFHRAAPESPREGAGTGRTGSAQMQPLQLRSQGRRAVSRAAASCSHAFLNWQSRARTCNCSTRGALQCPIDFLLLVSPVLLLHACAADACSGIDMECLQADMRSSSAESSCLPRAEGAVCTMAQQQLTCSAGFCGGARRRANTPPPALMRAGRGLTPLLTPACLPACLHLPAHRPARAPGAV